MESDRLLPTSINDNVPGRGRKEGRRSTWFLICVMIFLSAVIIVDIRLRITTPPVYAKDDVDDDYEKQNKAKKRDSPYHATQFISFNVNTLGGLAEHGECEERKVDPASNSCYLGDDDIETDVTHRLAILEEILYILRNDVFEEEPEIDRDPGVLKILMMPEFLLRGSKGAYDSKEMFDSNNDKEDGILIQMADKLRELIRDDAFKDYLFVLGTVIIAEPADHESNHWEDATDIQYYNFAPVYRGGEDWRNKVR